MQVIVFDMDKGPYITNECDLCKRYFKTHTIPEEWTLTERGEEIITDYLKAVKESYPISDSSETIDVTINICKSCTKKIYKTK